MICQKNYFYKKHENCKKCIKIALMWWKNIENPPNTILIDLLFEKNHHITVNLMQQSSGLFVMYMLETLVEDIPHMVVVKRVIDYLALLIGFHKTGKS